MNAAGIRRGHAVQGPNPVDPGDPGAHGHRQGHGAGRGHYRGYAFRHPRSAAPPSARRPVPLRPRQPPGGTPQAGVEHEADLGQALQRAGLGMHDPWGEQQGMPRVQNESESDLGERRGGEDDARQERQMARLRCALGRRPLPGPGPQAWLQGSGLPGVDLLCGPRDGATGAAVARAAVQAMLGAIGSACARAVHAAAEAGGRGTAAVLLAIQKQHVQRWSGTGAPCEAPATLAEVKLLLLECAPLQRALPAGEAQQNAYALAPVMALNLARPRTAAQRGLAASRLELLAAAMAREQP
jgi:hypothetical protein